MASNDNDGLFSKMVSFVSPPSLPRRSAPDSGMEAEGAELPDRVAIQTMMDRKLHNDAVRRREFELLRQMRKREPHANRIDLSASASQFLAGVKMPPIGRAQTIKKIDEIEQQMSQQWWKGKQIKNAFHVSRKGSLAAGGTASQTPTLKGINPRVPEYEPQQGNTMQGRLEASLLTDEPPSVSSNDFAPTQAEQFSYDPAIEDASVQFANGDYEGTLNSLREVLRTGTGRGDQEDVWLTLFDLFRATGDRTRFDGAAIDFAARFGRSAPNWGGTTELQPLPLAPEISTAAVGTGTDWAAPASLDIEAVAKLKDLLEKGAEPWRLNWSKLARIQDTALPELVGLFSSWCAQQRHLHFYGSQALDKLLRVATVAGNSELPREWWLLRLDMLRLARNEDEFELVALDYCITYEMSPPAWAPSLSEVQWVQAPVAAAVHVDTDHEPLTMGEELLTTLAGALTTSTGPWKSTTFDLADAADEPAPRFGLAELAGELLGDATQALEQLAQARGQHKKLVIDCRSLVRVDFQAAGNLLNWTADCVSTGCKLEFKNMNRIVAVFFSVIGIDDADNVRIVLQPH